jgi:hypothetical protein
VVNGFLPGDDWEAEYDAMTKGGEMFLRTLVEYLTSFAGRTATPITAFGPPVTDWEHAWKVLNSELGLTGTAAEGDDVRFTFGALAPVTGEIYFVNAHTLGVRTSDALYRFVRGMPGMVAMHLIFSDDVDRTAVEGAWQSCLAEMFS